MSSTEVHQIRYQTHARSKPYKIQSPVFLLLIRSRSLSDPWSLPSTLEALSTNHMHRKGLSNTNYIFLERDKLIAVQLQGDFQKSSKFQKFTFTHLISKTICWSAGLQPQSSHQQAHQDRGSNSHNSGQRGLESLFWRFNMTYVHITWCAHITLMHDMYMSCYLNIK